MPRKTPAKRKADAVTFEDDVVAAASAQRGDEGGDGDRNSGAGAAATTAKTPKASKSTSTPHKQKTPVSSGMTMRSGRKKKRSRSGAAAAGGQEEEGRKRARKGSGGASSSTEEAATKTMNGKAGRGRKMMDEDEEDEEIDEDEEMEEGEGSSSEDADADADMEGDEKCREKGKGEPTETTKKVPPEATRKAVAAAQVTESSGEKGGGEEEEEDDDDNGDATAAPGGAPSNGGGGLLRLVSHTLRLPSQHTPKPPGGGAATLASSGSPAMPPGGRRLIFTTAKKADSTATTRNKLLLQTRQSSARKSARNAPKGKGVATATADGVGSRSASQQPSRREELPSALDRMRAAWDENGEAIARDVRLYTKGWCLLLLLVFAARTAASVLFADRYTDGEGWMDSFGSWNVRAQSARWGEWYGVRSGNITDDVAEDDAVGSKGEGDGVGHIKTMTDPTLLTSARATLRAQRMNLHDIHTVEQSMEELATGLNALNAELEAWKRLHPEARFEKGALRKAEGDGGGDVKRKVIEEINSSDVVMFSKSYCPHCKAAKKLFQTVGQEAHAVELDLLPDDEGDAMQSALLELTGQKTVPNVFVRGRHAGGNDDVQALLRSGELEGMLAVDFVAMSLEPSAEETTRDGKVTSYEKIDRMKSTIVARKNLLLEWEWALADAEEDVDLLQRGAVATNEANEAISALSKASMVSVETAVLDAMALPGEGCEDLDYAPMQSKEPGERGASQEGVVEVVGGIDVDAVDLASDTPVRLEEVQIAYDDLVMLSEATAETLVGGASASPTPHAQRWIDQVIVEELQTKGVDDKPLSIEALYPPLDAPDSTLTPPSGGVGLYNARATVRDVDRLLESENADRTGKFDYASIVNGAYVVRQGPYATSFSYYETLPLLNRILAFAKFRFYGHGPEAALVPKTGPMHGRGQCWSFSNESSSSRARKRALDGTNGDILGKHATLTVSLASAVMVTEVIVEHPHPSSELSTAIKEFRVVGFEDSDAYADPWELGTFTFSPDEGKVQAFSVPTVLDEQSVPRLKAIAIAVESSTGGEYSCIYRVRVHGQP